MTTALTPEVQEAAAELGLKVEVFEWEFRKPKQRVNLGESFTSAVREWFVTACAENKRGDERGDRTGTMTVPNRCA